MKQVLVGDVAYFGRCVLTVSAVWLIGASLAYAQVPGLEAPKFGEQPQQPDTPRPAPADPATPDPMEPMPALPAEQPTPDPGMEEPYVPPSTPAEDQIKLGAELMEQGKSDLALQHFEEATKLAAEPVEQINAFFHLGNAYRVLNRLDDAIDAYSFAIQISSENNLDDGEVFLRRGIAWFYKGEYGIAWDDFDDASAIFLGEEPHAELWKGLTKARQGQLLDAINSYAAALSHNPRFALAYTNRGLAYLQINAPDKALVDFNQAIRFDHKNAVHYFRRGVAQSRMGRLQDAIDSYTQAIRLNPDYAEALFNRSLLHGSVGDAARANSDRARQR